MLVYAQICALVEYNVVYLRNEKYLLQDGLQCRILLTHALIAQSAEHLAVNQGVTGSSPV